MRDHRSGQLLAYGVAAVVVVVVGARLLAPSTSAPAVAPAPISVDAPEPSPTAGSPRGASSARGVYVHVAGAVRRPGIYRLPADARVSAAVKRARGPTGRAEIAAVNLAAPVRDGQQVVVPLRGAAGAMAPGAPGTAGAGESRVSLSQATPEQLDQLDGIGPALAKRIVEHRSAHGGFRSVDELNQVEGIGPKRFEALRAAVDP